MNIGIGEGEKIFVFGFRKGKTIGAVVGIPGQDFRVVFGLAFLWGLGRLREGGYFGL